ncbi:dienelactone hydrolase family protein [Leptospira broomii serovar Hurstbridge str. 5399]|uniref:Dienelactone hydrolase family protein n=1 Tax=Leptospira broomii serovar Hurstbridge str. 5399 TaxID=1049789 RepID=T0F0X7_9LEPT|nr:dienelactone hydrolase family protein [Leptospira broomii]EQA44805.1 dienelactone hydrolase family protein [Leptospira broomii serovar Hurstbridge str. 5399]
MKNILIIFSILMLIASSVSAKVKTETVEYKQGDTTLEGFLAYPEGKDKKAPGIILVHDWFGLGENTKARAKQLAALGYVAFAADIYGKGVRPKSIEEAAKLAGSFREGDRKLLRARAQAALDALKSQSNVDADNLAILGYCFGGTAALELARTGAPLKGTISFHGGLSTPKPEESNVIKGKVLAMHGADDPFVKAEEVAAFQEEMRKAKIDWQFVSYGGAVHSFTIKEAGNDNSKGAAYNEKADHRSWVELRNFLKEIFPSK